MAHDFLTDFLAKLQDSGELVRVATSVDAALELGAIVDRVSKSREGGPAILFENVKNSSIPVVANLLGSVNRICMALGVDSLDQAALALDRSVTGEPPSSWLDVLKLSLPASASNRLAPRVIKTAVCQQVVKLGRDVSLWDLPIPRLWPQQANPVLTSAHVLTRHPVTGAEHWGSFPLQITGPREVVPHWHRHLENHRHWQVAIREKRQLPVAICLGGDPLLSLMANAPLPVGVDRGTFGGMLRGASIDLVKARSIDLEVIAGAEIVIEGYVDHAADLQLAPPIAEDSGHYSQAESLPVIQVTAVTHRANPVLPVIVPGRPPNEACWMTKALSRLFLPMARRLIPDLVDWNRPFSGTGRSILFASIQKDSPQQARRVLNAIWGQPHFPPSKLAVIVDADVNVQREEEVWYAVASNVHPGRDVVLNETATNMDDISSPLRGIGHAMGIDATRKSSDEGHPRDWPIRLEHSADLIDRISARWSEFGIPEP